MNYKKDVVSKFLKLINFTENPICFVHLTYQGTKLKYFVQAQAEKFDETLKTSPEDRDALEVRYSMKSQLQKIKEAEVLLRGFPGLQNRSI